MNRSPDLIWFNKQLACTQLVRKLEQIQLVVTDVDGCLTDDSVTIFEDGNEAKSFSIQDGFLISRAQKTDITIAFLSGRTSNATCTRAKKLGISDELIYTNISKGKISTLKKIMQTCSVKDQQILYFGDDIMDLELKDSVSLFAAPANALFYIKHAADLVVPKIGGHGAFRLLLDLLLYTQNKHPVQKIIKKILKTPCQH